MRRMTMALVAGMALGGAQIDSPRASDPLSEPENSFVLLIDAGRMEVFADKIETALDIDREEGDPYRDPLALSEVQHASASVRNAALAYFSLKARACIDGQFTDITCTPSTLPAWLADAPNSPVSAEEVRKRSDALYAEMGPLLNAACEYGKSKLNDPLFCSVE